MPYSLSGTSVIRSDTGAVVKKHPTREKALAHLRALKANVEESAGVLDSLLEGFEEAAHPRDWRGRFRVGDKVTYQHGLFGAMPATVTRVTKSRVEILPNDPRANATSMTHNQAAVRLEHNPLAAASPGEARAQMARQRAQEPLPASKPEPSGRFKPGDRVQGTDAQGRPMGPPARVEDHNPDGSVTVRDSDGNQQTYTSEKGLVPARSSLGTEADALMRARAAAAATDRHGGFRPGDVVSYREPSIVNGRIEGYGPQQARRVAGLQRNGYLRLREPKTGTTVDVHHRNVSLIRRGIQEGQPSGIGILVEAFAAAPPETPAQSMAIGARQTTAAQKEVSSGAFNPSKHPRARGGRFGYTTGGKRAKKGRSKSGAVTQGNTLTVGTSGALVRSIQRQLGIAQDGSYGQQTRAAVMRFQTQHGLKVDGVVGRQTLAALRGQQGAASIAPGPIGVRQARIVKPRSPRAPVRMAGGQVV